MQAGSCGATDQADIEPLLAAGKVASYIPELGKIDPAQFGMAVVLADGTAFTAGDADTLFSIQSVSKVFALTLALGIAGDGLWNRVGREPSGNRAVRFAADRG